MATNLLFVAAFRKRNCSLCQLRRVVRKKFFRAHSVLLNPEAPRHQMPNDHSTVFKPVLGGLHYEYPKALRFLEEHDRARAVQLGEFNKELEHRLAALDRGEHVDSANTRSRLQRKSG
jgi:hypothetical protein